MKEQLQKKVDRAIHILQSAQKAYPDEVIEISYSGGKDSDVILELAKMAGIKYEAIYKNTTIDPPGTIRHAEEMGATILRPKKSFYQLIEEKGYPTRRARFCCEVLKEYKVRNVAVQGIRRSESKAREDRYKEPQICRVYSKKERVKVFLPILDWTDQDVKEFIEERGIRCAPIYYDDNGDFHVERRLGCIGCPMASDNGLRAFKKYPGLVKIWLRRGGAYLNSHPNCSSRTKFKDEYELFVHNVFFDSYQEFKEAVYGLFGTEDCKKFLEDYFKIKL